MKFEIELDIVSYGTSKAMSPFFNEKIIDGDYIPLYSVVCFEGFLQIKRRLTQGIPLDHAIRVRDKLEAEHKKLKRKANND